jgi:hypothetical protein
MPVSSARTHYRVDCDGPSGFLVPVVKWTITVSLNQLGWPRRVRSVESHTTTQRAAPLDKSESLAGIGKAAARYVDRWGAPENELRPRRHSGRDLYVDLTLGMRRSMMDNESVAFK